jgi:hypothetical protein
MIQYRRGHVESVSNECSRRKNMTTTTTTIVHVTIEGAPYDLENREYTGHELRDLASVPNTDKLVREEPDGSETAIPPGRKVQPHEGDNFFVSVRFRRG